MTRQLAGAIDGPVAVCCVLAAIVLTSSGGQSVSPASVEGAATTYDDVIELVNLTVSPPRRLMAAIGEPATLVISGVLLAARGRDGMATAGGTAKVTCENITIDLHVDRRAGIKILDVNHSVVVPPLTFGSSEGDDDDVIPWKNCSLTVAVLGHQVGIWRLSASGSWIVPTTNEERTWSLNSTYEIRMSARTTQLGSIARLGIFISTGINMAAFGCKLNFAVIRSYIRRPTGILTGFICQFGLLPTVGHCMDRSIFYLH